MTLAIRTLDTADGVRASARWTLPNGRVIERRAHVGWEELEHAEPEEVGRFGERLVKTAQRAARVRALRGLARVAIALARQTSSGEMALAAVRTARGALRAARSIEDASTNDLSEVRPPDPSPRLPRAADEEVSGELWMSPRLYRDLTRLFR